MAQLQGKLSFSFFKIVQEQLRTLSVFAQGKKEWVWVVKNYITGGINSTGLFRGLWYKEGI